MKSVTFREVYHLTCYSAFYMLLEALLMLHGDNCSKATKYHRSPRPISLNLACSAFRILRASHQIDVLHLAEFVKGQSQYHLFSETTQHIVAAITLGDSTLHSHT